MEEFPEQVLELFLLFLVLELFLLFLVEELQELQELQVVLQQEDPPTEADPGLSGARARAAPGVVWGLPRLGSCIG